MILKEPKSIGECVYFTQRIIDKGHVKAWVLKELCPKCKKGIMSKPHNPKTGRIQIRSNEYKCPECGYTAEKQEYEDTLTANIQYICPYCLFKGETQVPFKRKKVQVFDEEKMKKKTIDSLRFQCEKCKKNIDITKKMK